MNEEPSGIEDRSMCSHGLGDGAAEISDQFSGFISDQVEENQLDENRNICFNDLEMEIVNEESPGIEDRSMCSHGLGDRAAEISDQFSGYISLYYARYHKRCPKPLSRAKKQEGTI